MLGACGVWECRVEKRSHAPESGDACVCGGEDTAAGSRTYRYTQSLSSSAYDVTAARRLPPAARGPRGPHAALRLQDYTIQEGTALPLPAVYLLC